MGDRDRQSIQPGRYSHGRHRLGAQPRKQFGSFRQLHSDRRRYQPRQFRRTAVQPQRRGDRRQHRDHLAVGRLDRHWLRGAVEDGSGGDRSTAPVQGSATRLAGCAHPAGDRRNRRQPHHNAPPRGVLPAAAQEKGPAKPAGIEPGDVIVKFDGQDIKEMRDLPKIVAETTVGKDGEVVVIRKGKEKKKTVKLGRLEDEKKEAALTPKKNESEEKTATKKVLGLDLANLTDELRKKHNIKDSVKGVLITGVDANSTPAEKRLAPGMGIAEGPQQQ